MATLSIPNSVGGQVISGLLPRHRQHDAIEETEVMLLATRKIGVPNVPGV